VGLKGITRDGMDYELTIVFDIDIKHFATVSKDRTGLFANQPEFRITAETGKAILNWCNSGSDPKNQAQPILESPEEVLKRIEACKSINELLELYNLFPQHQASLLPQFTTKRQALETKPILQIQNLDQNGNTNGTGTHPVR
jgi:hypothetical protein